MCQNQVYFSEQKNLQEPAVKSYKPEHKVNGKSGPDQGCLINNPFSTINYNITSRSNMQVTGIFNCLVL